MINALGGVPMCIPGRIVSAKAGVNLKPGPQILNGSTALAWARLRTAEVGKKWVEGSDLQRIKRQQTLLAHTLEVALSKNLLTNQGQLRDFITAGADSMTTSPRLADASFILGLAFSLRHVQPENIVFTTVPNKYSPDFLNVTWTPAAKTDVRRHQGGPPDIRVVRRRPERRGLRRDHAVGELRRHAEPDGDRRPTRRLRPVER